MKLGFSRPPNKNKGYFFLNSTLLDFNLIQHKYTIHVLCPSIFLELVCQGYILKINNLMILNKYFKNNFKDIYCKV